MAKKFLLLRKWGERRENDGRWVLKKYLLYHYFLICTCISQTYFNSQSKICVTWKIVKKLNHCCFVARGEMGRIWLKVEWDSCQYLSSKIRNNFYMFSLPYWGWSCNTESKLFLLGEKSCKLLYPSLTFIYLTEKISL